MRTILDGGGYGSIVGRNPFQGPKARAIDMLNKITKIHLGNDP
jgi:fructose-bisphosphate aldolase, class I